MIKVGDKVKYHGVECEIRVVMDDMVMVKMPDGKDYALPYSAISSEEGPVVPPAPDETDELMEEIIPYLKDMAFLNKMARKMSEAGVSELTVLNGAIQKFTAKESLEEKLAKYKAEALKAAEEKAKREFDEENKQ